MKLDRLAAAALLFAASSAWAGPVLVPGPNLTAPIELAHWRRHHRHHHHHHWDYDSSDGPYEQADRSYAEDAAAPAAKEAIETLFWPVWGDNCFFGDDCGYTAAKDPGCYFYACSYGWNMGVFAWGLFGLGFYDPYAIFGLADVYPVEAGFDYATLGLNVGAIASGVNARPFVAADFAARNFAAMRTRGRHFRGSRWVHDDNEFRPSGGYR